MGQRTAQHKQVDRLRVAQISIDPAEKPVKPVKPVKPIRDIDWLTGLTTLIGYFEVPFSISGTSYRCIISSTSRRSIA
jgi:hypothetical protein